MTSNHGAIIVIGSGPGIGRNVASYFAEQGFNEVYLLSRDPARLQQDVTFVKNNAPRAACEAIEIDLADRRKVEAALKTLDSKLQGRPLECVLYNAARVGTSKLTEGSGEEYERDLMISAVSMLTIAQWAMPKLVEAGKTKELSPSFLVTSGGLHKNPFPQFFSLASCKAAQYNLTTSLHKEYGPQGVHCAAIVVEGRVSDQAQVTTARNVAKEAWKLYQQPAPGDLDVSIQDPEYLTFIQKTQA